MLVAGIDLSMSCPAISVIDTDLFLSMENMRINYLIGTKKYQINLPNRRIYGDPIFKDYKSNEERWSIIAEWVLDCVRGCEWVNLESQSFGSSGSMLCQISEMHGVLKYVLFKHQINIKLTPPTQNKKTFSGKGNATKLEMIDAFKSKYNINLVEEFDLKGDNLHPVEDIVDSVALMESLYNEARSKKI